MAQSTNTGSGGPGEFLFFALEFLPDELWVLSLVIGAVLLVVWIARALFIRYFSHSHEASG
jgi:hypothetical protein